MNMVLPMFSAPFNESVEWRVRVRGTASRLLPKRQGVIIVIILSSVARWAGDESHWNKFHPDPTKNSEEQLQAVK